MTVYERDIHGETCFLLSDWTNCGQQLNRPEGNNMHMRGHKAKEARHEQQQEEIDVEYIMT
jgi:hypothetical protein